MRSPTAVLHSVGVFSGTVTVPVRTLVDRLVSHGVCQWCAQAVADALRASKRPGIATATRKYWTVRALIRLDRCEAGECEARKRH